MDAFQDHLCIVHLDTFGAFKIFGLEGSTPARRHAVTLVRFHGAKGLPYRKDKAQRERMNNGETSEKTCFLISN